MYPKENKQLDGDNSRPVEQIIPLYVRGSNLRDVGAGPGRYLNTDTTRCPSVSMAL
jgi:hypothetical protein